MLMIYGQLCNGHLNLHFFSYHSSLICLIWSLNSCFLNPAGKQKCPFFPCKKWTLQGPRRDFATRSTVTEVTAWTLPNGALVWKPLHGPLRMTPKDVTQWTPQGPFFKFFKSCRYRQTWTLFISNCPLWSSWLGIGLPCKRPEFNSLQWHYSFFEIDFNFSVVHSDDITRCLRVDLENVHPWTPTTSTRVDISKCVHKCTLFHLFETSTRGHFRGLREDIAFQQGTFSFFFFLSIYCLRDGRIRRWPILSLSPSIVVGSHCCCGKAQRLITAPSSKPVLIHLIFTTS
jgi:hypothetical protein